MSWDSDFFGKKIARLNGPADGENLSEYDLIYANSPLDSPDFELTFSETRVVFSKQLSARQGEYPEIIPVTTAGLLYELAFESGKYSRFNLDPGFGRDAFGRLYRAWVDNSVNGKFADEVLGFSENGQILGFVTYDKKDNYAQIGLIAVDPSAQGKGIGKKLLETVENRLLASGITELRIPTQLENVPACRFYEKQGYAILESSQVLHFWKRNA